MNADVTRVSTVSVPLPRDPYRLALHETPLPTNPELEDRAVRSLSSRLAAKEIALVVGGGIAAYKTPELVRLLRRYGAHVHVYPTREARKLVGIDALRWAVGEEGSVFDGKLSGEVEHLGPRRGGRFDAYVVCPATYNLVNKAAQGIADDPVTTLLAAALGRCERAKTRLLFVPTMNGDMTGTALYRSLGLLERSGAFLMQPRTENGKWELPDIRTVAVALCRQLSTSWLADRAVLVTAGPTPVRVDSVRVITNIFRGAIGEKVAEELLLRGAHVRLLFGGDMERLPSYLRAHAVHYRDFDQYRSFVRTMLAGGLEPGVPYSAGVFSSAVADYRPTQMFDGKISSGSKQGITLPPLVPTPKIIEEARDLAPQLQMATFKLMVGVSEEELLAEARRRLERYQLVVANLLSDLNQERRRHSAWLVSRDGEERHDGDKAALAVKIVDRLERCVKASIAPQGKPLY